MKKLLTLTLVLLASISIFAQEKSISKEEFDAVQKKGFSKYSGKSYRVITITEDYQDEKKSPNSTKTISEVVSPNVKRSVFESISPSSVSRTETIKIGDTTYTKRKDEEWKIAEVPAIKPKSASPISTIEQQLDYKFLGNEKLDNQNTTVYQYIMRRKMINVTNNIETFSTVTHKYWFGEDGGMLKQELTQENRHKANTLHRKEMVLRYVRTTIWELDPNIKIEAPKIN